MKRSVLALILLLVSNQALGAIQTESVEYRHGDKVLMGLIAYDDATQGKRPGVLVVHQWKGFSDYVKRRASMLAELGYVDKYFGILFDELTSVYAVDLHRPDFPATPLGKV